MKVINPFNQNSDRISYYVYSEQPVEYKGFLVAYNPKGSYDVVKDGVCISQRVTQRAAKGFIDIILTQPDDFFVKRALSFLENK